MGPITSIPICENGSALMTADAARGVFLILAHFWHVSQFCTNLTTSSCIPGHHTDCCKRKRVFCCPTYLANECLCAKFKIFVMFFCCITGNTLPFFFLYNIISSNSYCCPAINKMFFVQSLT